MADWHVGRRHSQSEQGLDERPNAHPADQRLQPDGTLEAGWSASGRPRVGNSTGKLTGETITLTTGEDAQIELTRSSDSTLHGTYRLSGKPYPLSMTKQ